MRFAIESLVITDVNFINLVVASVWDYVEKNAQKFVWKFHMKMDLLKTMKGIINLNAKIDVHI